MKRYTKMTKGGNKKGTKYLNEDRCFKKSGLI